MTKKKVSLSNSQENSNDKIFLHPSLPVISDTMIAYFYKELLLFHESNEILRLSGKSPNNNPFKKAIKENAISCFYVSNEQHKQKFFHKEGERWKINSVDIYSLVNELIFLEKAKYNVLQNTVYHIRNAFAHNNIVKDGKYLIIGDFERGKQGVNFNKPTMLARIEEKKLLTLIRSIKDMCK